MRSQLQSGRGARYFGRNRGEVERRQFVIVCVAAALLLVVAPLAWAGTYTVSTVNDSGAGSLRYAIEHATSGDTIQVDVAGPIDLSSTLEVQTPSITIEAGAGYEPVISGQGICTVFKIDSMALNVTLSGLTIQSGSATVARHGGQCGGGIFNDARDFNLENCTFSDNSAAYEGGGMENDGIDATVTDCTFSGNSAYYGGGMYNEDPAAVTHCTFSDNSADNDGGGMYNYSATATVTHCTFVDNTASDGGGMENYTGTVTLTDCAFSGNSADSDGGGMYNFSTATAANCTFADNTASDGGGMFDSGTVTLTNCTFSGNSANGGGIYALGAHNCTVTYCTFTDNRATGTEGGGIYVSSNPTTPTVTLGATIVAGNTAGASGSGSDIYGSVTSNGYNLVGHTSGTSGLVSTDLTGVNPKLVPLADNGGSVETCELQASSPALDAVPRGTFSSAFPQTLFPSGPTDARGVVRPQGSACDIGAYEYRLQRGDVNGDGVIDLLDVRLCHQIALGVIQGTAAQRQRADMNQDGRVTLADAQLLAQYVMTH
jgi:parallel beta-helix repeat protein